MSKALTPDEVLGKVGKAMEALGVTGDIAMMDVTPGDTGRIKVFVSNEYFGIYDTVRDTFVD